MRSNDSGAAALCVCDFPTANLSPRACTEPVKAFCHYSTHNTTNTDCIYMMLSVIGNLDGLKYTWGYA